MPSPKPLFTDRHFPHALRMSAIALSMATFSVVTFAQTSTADTSPTSTSSATTASVAQKQSAVRASKFIGMHVQGADGKNVGKIKDLIVNVSTAEVRYAILEFDPGFLKSDKLFAVPLSAFSYVADDKPLVYKELTRAQLDKAAVSKADWQKALENSRYVLELDNNYGLNPPAGDFRSMRASKLLGKDVDSRDKKSIGKINDLVLNVQGNKVDYVVLAFDPSWFSKDKMFAFPLTAFKVNGDKDDLILDVDQKTVQSMKNFDAKEWGHLNDLNRDELINRPAPKQ
ncbi:PRC-barrel domain-containing protein [Pusillimonas sp. ANT_WB101]|uniref:PRC-barrel domain-containing protein n=1 Tax=Pusillimonas sp. ANT_WB101 TaxID=2597356 RepID=UPI00165DF3B4|nr:PRC-barrel domain-containing protein [Pusillimonas sp. ANT_WB101]